MASVFEGPMGKSRHGQNFSTSPHCTIGPEFKGKGGTCHGKDGPG